METALKCSHKIFQCPPQNHVAINTRHAVRPFLSPILFICRDLIPTNVFTFALHPFSVSPLALFPPSFPFPIHIQKKLFTTLLNLYGNSKPLILWEPDGKMLSAIKPQNCSMSNRDPELAPCNTRLTHQQRLYA